MSKILQEKAKEIADKVKEVNRLHDEVGDNEPTQEQVTKIKELNKEIEELEVKYDELESFELGKKANDDRAKKFGSTVTKSTDYSTDVKAHTAEELQKAKAAATLISDLCMNDPAFKSFVEKVVPGSKAQLGQSEPVAVPALMKTLLTGLSSTSAGAFVVNDRLNIFDSYFQRELTVADLVTRGSTNSDTVEYVRQGTVTNNAAPVAEATATGDGSGVKPESGFLLSIITETVRTIAHWIPATRRALADAGQLRTLIDSFLRYGLMEELEDQMLTGAGTGENFTGVYNTSGIQTQAWSNSMIESARKARTKIKVTGKTNPTAWVMHPNDWEDFDLLKDGEDRYYYGGPMVMGTPRLWGVPVVETEAATENLAILGNWKMAVLWDREQANISVSDSHSDFFIRNLVAILAELRAAFGVIRPAAFCTVDLLA